MAFAVVVLVLSGRSILSLRLPVHRALPPADVLSEHHVRSGRPGVQRANESDVSRISAHGHQPTRFLVVPLEQLRQVVVASHLVSRRPETGQSRGDDEQEGQRSVRLGSVGSVSRVHLLVHHQSMVGQEHDLLLTARLAGALGNSDEAAIETGDAHGQVSRMAVDPGRHTRHFAALLRPVDRGGAVY